MCALHLRKCVHANLESLFTSLRHYFPFLISSASFSASMSATQGTEVSQSPDCALRYGGTVYGFSYRRWLAYVLAEESERWKYPRAVAC